MRDFPLALHTWTLDTTPLETALSAAKAAGFDAVELRRIDFTRCAERGLSNAATLDLIRRAGMPVCTLGVEYGWLFAKGEESRRLFGVFRETCANAAALDCGLLMSAPGPLTGSLAEAIANLRIASDIAGEFGLRLALEFNSQHEFLNSLDVARRILDGAGRPNCGFMLDAYHLHRSGRPGRGFRELGGEEIFGFQYSDVPSAPVVGVRRPVDRLPPGQGVVDWHGVFQLLAEKNYGG
ncbi:MAG TPA: sugar phosphate isomerase/epimerase family protein, partial [Hyphomicrobiaceae bacterium]|nr:sugar phosphate isomerase/epimerase family protein [Hyphomicrobiaceae bacterium]